MKIGFYDTDPAGGMTPMIIELKERGISFEQRYFDNLKSTKGFNIFIIDSTGLPHYQKKVLENYCKEVRNLVESNCNTKFLIQIPGEEWIMGMNKRWGVHENIEYVTDGEGDVSKLIELLGESK